MLDQAEKSHTRIGSVEERPAPPVTPEPGTPGGRQNTPILRRLLPHLLVLAAFTVLTTIATWPMFPQLGGFAIDKGDPLYSIWAMAWQAHSLSTHPLNLFNANIMYPFQGTLAFDELSFAEAVMAAPFYYVTGNPVFSHNLILFLTFVISGYGMWLLVRDMTGNGWAGFVAGAAFAFCFYRLNHLPHMTLISTEWMPFMLLAAYKLLWTRTWRWALALGGLFAVQALSGHYLAFYSAMLLGIFFLYYWIFEPRVRSMQTVGKLAVGMILAVLIMLPIVVPFVLLQGEYQFSRNLFEVERFSNTLSSFLALFRGNPVLRQLLAPFADPGPWSIERAAFPGFTVVILALVALFWRTRRGRNAGETGAPSDVPPGAQFGPVKRHAYLYGFIALLSAILSLGPNLQLTYAANNYDPNAVQRIMPLPYLLLHEWVPGFQSMRVVARIDVLTAFALSILAGLGAFYLLRKLNGSKVWASRARWAVPALAIALALLPILESWSPPINMSAVGTRGAVPQIYRWMATQPATVMVEYPMVYYKPGDPNVEMANLYQYYSTYHWQKMINASTTIRPYSYSAVVLETEDCFPCPRSLDTLRALDVENVVVHLENLSGPERTDFLWRATNPVAKVVDDFILVEDFGGDRAYQLKPRAIEELKTIIPEGASILLADPADDPIRGGDPNARVSGGYVAALGHMLRDHPQFGDSRLSLGQKIQPVDPANLPEYAILWANQDPTPHGYKPETRVWNNEFVSVYKRGGTLAHMNYPAAGSLR